MAEVNKVADHFSTVADGYQKASTGVVWGLVRRRETAAVFTLLGHLTGKDVLELGCGAGFYTRHLLANGARHVWAVDISQPMLDQLPKTGVTPLLADAAAVDPGRTFATMLSAGMLEFVPDPGQALRRAADLAEPDARLVVLYPTVSMLGRAYRRFHARNGLSIGLFDERSLSALASANGWQLAQTTTAGPYSKASLLVRAGR